MTYRPRHYPLIHRCCWTRLPYSFDTITEQTTPWNITANFSLSRSTTSTYSGDLWEHIESDGPIVKGIQDSYFMESFGVPNGGDSVDLRARLLLQIKADFPNSEAGWPRQFRRTIAQEYRPEITVQATGSVTSQSFFGLIYSFVRTYSFLLDGPPTTAAANLETKSVLPSIWHPGVKGEDVYTVASSGLVKTMITDTEVDNSGSYGGPTTLVTECQTVRDTIRPIADAWTGQGVFRAAAHQIPFDVERFRTSGQYLATDF